MSPPRLVCPKVTSFIASIQAAFDGQMSKRSLAEKVIRLGIDKLIKYSPRGGKGSPKVLSIALRAIVGAVWIDNGKDEEVLFSVIDQFK
jgi:dsRNA-specific ribonuclease